MYIRAQEYFPVIRIVCRIFETQFERKKNVEYFPEIRIEGVCRIFETDARIHD